MGEGVPPEFDAVFRALYPRARAVAHRILADPAAAEDAAAEAFARALVRWRRLADLPYLDAWILRVTANVAIDAVRRQRVFEAAVPQVAAPADETAAEEIAVLRLSLVAALTALPRRQREVIALRYLAGLPQDEIARSLGVSLGSVKRHGHRGMAVLRRRLGPEWDWSRPIEVTRVAF